MPSRGGATPLGVIGGILGCGVILAGNTALDLVEHKAYVQEAGATAQKERVKTEKATVEEMMTGASKTVKKWLERIVQRECIILPLHRIDGTTLLKEEWWNNTRLWYGMRPTDLCSHCDVCGAGYMPEQTLSCKKGGLMVIRHDDTRDKAGALTTMALVNSKVTYGLTIFTVGALLRVRSQKRRKLAARMQVTRRGVM